MLEIIREYSFDVNFETGKFKRTDGSEERIKLVQNDNESTKFKFNFEEEIADNTNVLVRLRQSTGYVKEYTMLIQNQKAEIILTNDILSESGSLTMSITLIGTDDEILTDTEYHSKIQVIASLEGDTEIPEQEKNVLVDLISQVNSLNQTASQLVEDTETAVTNSSTVLANAETALQNANTATSNANQAAESANNAVTELDNRLANKVDKVSGKSLSTNDFTNEYKQKLENLENYDDSEILQELNNKADINDIPDTSDFINNTVNNLLNYYLKSETYSKTEVNNLIGQIATLQFQVVNELPVTGDSRYIYLTPSSSPKTQNIKDEYIWFNNAWEQIGSTQVNLTGYATESWVNSQISSFLTSTQIQNLISASLSVYVQDSNYVHTDNNYTTEEKNKVTSIDEQNDRIERAEMIYNALPKITQVGTEMTINDTAECPMNIVLKPSEITKDMNIITGDNRIIITTKNIYNKSLTHIINHYINPTTGENTGNVNNVVSDYILVKSNTYYRRNKRYSSYDTTKVFLSSLTFYDKNKNFISGTWWSAEYFLTPANTKYIRVSTSYYNTVSNILEMKEDFEKDFQLEEGQTITTFVEYKEQNLPLSLGNLEFGKIGSYEDIFFKNTIDNELYDSNLELNKWYLKKNIGKATDEVESTEITLDDMVSNGTIYSYCGGTVNDKTITYDSAINETNTIYYQLSNPIDILLNNILQEQLDNIQKVMSYQEKTYILQINDDLSFSITATTIYDLNKLVTRVATLEIE